MRSLDIFEYFFATLKLNLWRWSVWDRQKGSDEVLSCGQAANKRLDEMCVIYERVSRLMVNEPLPDLEG